MLDNIIVGKQIASLRKKNGLTQEELAEKLDISAQAISKWENGHTLPETMQLPFLAQIFGCSIDSILAPFTVQDSNFQDFINTINTEYAELALQLYSKMKDKFSFTIDYKNEYYIFDQVFNGSCITFNNPNRKDFLMRMDVESKTSEKSKILVRLPLQNCSSYMNIVNNMSENIKKSFRCNDCTGCNLNKCPVVMAYTFEGVDYRQCHFIGVHLNSLETMEQIFTLLCEEHGV
ncbi:MAG: helix-turn-helix domain-containing protein [Candidatus Cloacimonetes bacterium]|nr:helix-turn-helix domain-containing protein [Candidatus Cloacimonadota bacterium]